MKTMKMYGIIAILASILTSATAANYSLYSLSRRCPLYDNERSRFVCCGYANNLMLHLQCLDNLASGASGNARCSQNLILSNINLTNIRDGAFVSLRDRLQELNLRNNLLTEIRNSTFRGLRSLRMLHLSGNLLATIAPGSFSDLKDLKLLDLSHNMLKTLQIPLLFDGLVELKVLYINYNKLTIIDGTSFGTYENTLYRSYFPNIIVLDLSHNELHEIGDYTFMDFNNLTTLSIDNNHLISLPSMMLQQMPLLMHLHASSNKLTSLNFNAPKGSRMSYLDLSQNLLTKVTVDDFTNMRELYKLDLSWNHLDSFDDNILMHVQHLFQLNLSNNRLLRLPSLQHSQRLKALMIDHNKITSIPQVLDKGYKGVLRLIHAHGNPWQCKCLDKLVREMLTHDIRINMNNPYFKGREPVCVVTSLNECISVEADTKWNRELIKTYEEGTSIKTYKEDTSMILYIYKLMF